MTAERPTGVAAVAAAFLLAAAYLLVVGLTMLARPGLVSMVAGAELLGGLELAGPYMFLLVGALGGVIALGLWRLQKWARWLAIVAAIIGVVLLLPNVSSAMLDFRIAQLAWSGLGTIVRVMIVWYLFQEPVREAFEGM
jgi:multidrug transporter EmrE-like cation transporter